jgi:hypothetical protein
VIRRQTIGIVSAVVILAACQTGTGTATPDAVPGASPGTTSSAEAPSSLGPPLSPSPPDETSPVVLDPTVLGFLPADVDGNAIIESADEAAQALSDPDLAKIATAVDAAVAVDSGHANLVYTWVVRLRPGALSDSIFGQWRDSYDEGACTTGIVGRAEATIDNRTVYITSCTQGLRTYHVWLKDQDILISASGIGDGKFGELLMDNLRLPGAGAS